MLDYPSPEKGRVLDSRYNLEGVGLGSDDSSVLGERRLSPLWYGSNDEGLTSRSLTKPSEDCPKRRGRPSLGSSEQLVVHVQPIRRVSQGLCLRGIIPSTRSSFRRRPSRCFS